jgi:hypothetical protein
MNEMTPPHGRRIIDGEEHIGDGKGGWQPVRLVKPQHMLEDEVVRKIIGYALPLSEQVARFKQHTFEDINSVDAILAQEYDAKLGGPKGNKTLMSVDGLRKVIVQIAEHIDYGPELQIAKALVDEYLNELTEGAAAELRLFVTRAFNTDKAGLINRYEIARIKRFAIEDPRWKRAMQAITDAERAVGSKTYVRCYHRKKFDAAWEPITIDLAKA